MLRGPMPLMMPAGPGLPPQPGAHVPVQVAPPPQSPWPGVVLLGVEAMLAVAHAPSLSDLASELAMLPLPALVSTSGRRSVAVGRQHQPAWFEAVLRDPALKSLISETAFEIAWGPDLGSAELHYTGPKESDEDVLVKASMAILSPGDTRRIRHGSQIAFSAPKQEMPFLVLSLMLPRFTFEVKHVRGMTPEVLGSLPNAARSFCTYGASQIVVGREHPPGWFEPLLSHEPALLGQISRTQFSVDAETAEPACPPPGAGLLRITNLGNALLVLEGRPLANGEAACVADGQAVSFVEGDGKGASGFLSFLVRVAPQSPHEEDFGLSGTDIADVQAVPVSPETNQTSPPGVHQDPAALRPSVGDTVLARYADGAHFYLARLERVHSGRADVKWLRPQAGVVSAWYVCVVDRDDTLHDKDLDLMRDIRHTSAMAKAESPAAVDEIDDVPTATVCL